MTAVAPNPWDVAIDDHGYKLDLATEAWRHESIPLLRPVYVTADRLGENDINPESNWRFSDVNWNHGAGQRFADETDSDSSRFWRSRGVNVWTKGQLSLLPALELRTVVFNGATRFFTVQGNTYLVNGSGTPGTHSLSFGAPNFTSVVVSAPGTMTACTDGKTVYYSDETQISSKAVGATGAGTLFNTVTGVAQLYYVSGRLIGVGSSGNILDITGSTFDDLGVLPGNFVPVDVASAINAIYVAAVNLDTGQSQVFAVTIDPSGTSLDPPVAATPPFDGTLHRILYYEGLVFLAQEEGIRLATPSSDGLALTLAPLIKTGRCAALAGRDGQVWFGMEQYELDASGSTYWSGLGRIDPTVIHDDGSPAWATDMMLDGFPFNGGSGIVPSQINDVAFPFTGDFDTNNGRAVILTTRGFMTPFPTTSPTLVASGYLDSGLISYDLPDDKAARYLTVRTDKASAGDVTPSIAVDGDTAFTALDVVPAMTLTQRDPIDDMSGGYFEIRETLAQDATDVTKGAILTRHMLESDPIVISGFFYEVPVILADSVITDDGQIRPMKPAEELAYLEGLRGTGTVVTYTEPGNAYQVTVEDITWQASHLTTARDGANGTFLLKLKTV